MVAPWFLQHLGLSTDADAAAIRQAYAAKLRGIDPATDPDGFGQLRRAYEAAREWLADTEDDAADAGNGIVPPPDSSPEVVRRLPENEAPAGPREFAEALGDELSRFLSDSGALDIAAELKRLSASAYGHHIETPYSFELTVLERMASGHLPRRAALYEAAFPHFGWDNLEHMRELGQAGEWVDRLELERRAFLTVQWPLRGILRELFENAGDDPVALDEHVIREWPQARRALQDHPRYLRLYVSDPVIEAWGRQFEADRLGLHRATGADRPRAVEKTPRPPRRGGLGIGAWLVLAFIAMVAVAASHSSAPWHPPAEPAPLAPHAYATDQATTPWERCEALIVHVASITQVGGMVPPEEQRAAWDCRDQMRAQPARGTVQPL